MQTELENIKKSFWKALENIASYEQLKDLESQYLGKKWELKKILAWVKDLSLDEKKIIGVASNTLKQTILSELEKKAQELEKQKYKDIEEKEKIDVTLKFPIKNQWHKHPISTTSELLEDIFISMGFKIEDGPHIEDEEHNFDKLNIPDDHPARDVWDTFWLSDKINKGKESGKKLLLRTHTSPVQIRTMLKGKLPIKIIVPGRVFRYEREDARHTSNFYQLEGLVVGEKVTFWDLKWTLDTAMKQLLWENTKTRFRPSIFPFTEPSAEVDVSCQICKWKGTSPQPSPWWEGAKWKSDCRMCSGTGWVELLGSGMVHPKVLIDCGIDPEKYSWFAFWMGIDRIAAQRFWVSSSRNFYLSELQLNEQF